MINKGNVGAHVELDAHEHEHRHVFRESVRAFVEHVRQFRSEGVGYGMMRQILGWEWKAESPGAHQDDEVLAMLARLPVEKERDALRSRLKMAEAAVKGLYLALNRIGMGADPDDNEDRETIEFAWDFLSQEDKEACNAEMRAYDEERLNAPDDGSDEEEFFEDRRRGVREIQSVDEMLNELMRAKADNVSPSPDRKVRAMRQENLRYQIAKVERRLELYLTFVKELAPVVDGVHPFFNEDRKVPQEILRLLRVLEESYTGEKASF